MHISQVKPIQEPYISIAVEVNLYTVNNKTSKEENFRGFVK